MRRDRTIRLLALVAIYLTITLLIPRPPSVTPAGWRITGIFLTTVSGLMLQPLSGAAMVLIGLTTRLAALGIAGVLSGLILRPPCCGGHH